MIIGLKKFYKQLHNIYISIVWQSGRVQMFYISFEFGSDGKWSCLGACAKSSRNDKISISGIPTNQIYHFIVNSVVQL